MQPFSVRSSYGGMELWEHQKRARDESNLYKKHALFWDPRLGKTQGTVECIIAWSVKKGVVVAPLVVCPQWVQTLRDNGFTVLEGHSCPSKALQSALKGFDGVIVINYDRLAREVEKLLKWKPEFTVLDESHWIKSPSAKRARAARRLCWSSKYVRILTGTPVPNNYGDLWGQMTCVDQEEWSKSYGKFASRHLIRHQIYPSKIIGYNDLPRIQQLLSVGAHTVRREDVFGPDEYQFIRRSISLPNAAEILYKRLAREWVLDNPNITAEHIFKRLVRLQQLSSGYLPTDSGPQEIHTAKIDTVMADLDEIVASGQKAILFHKFTWEGERYIQEIQKRFPGVPVGRIFGGTDLGERTDAINLIENTEGSALIVANTRAGGIGISFRNAQHAMFISSGYSFVERKQAIDRIYSPGARKVVTDYLVAGTIEVAIERAVSKKQDIHEYIRHHDLQSLVFGT